MLDESEADIVWEFARLAQEAGESGLICVLRTLRAIVRLDLAIGCTPDIVRAVWAVSDETTLSYPVFDHPWIDRMWPAVVARLDQL